MREQSLIGKYVKMCLVVLMLFTLVGCKVVEVGTGGEELKAGDAAPDFSLELAGGGTFTLSEQRDKVVLLNLWATWCGPCVGELPAFERLKSEYGDKVFIVAANCAESKKEVDAFLKENGYTFPVAYDEQGSLMEKYPTQGIPYTVIIGKDGIIRKTFVGAADADTQYQEYKSALDKVLGE